MHVYPLSITHDTGSLQQALRNDRSENRDVVDLAALVPLTLLLALDIERRAPPLPALLVAGARHRRTTRRDEHVGKQARVLGCLFSVLEVRVRLDFQHAEHGGVERRDVCRREVVGQAVGLGVC